MTIRDRSSTAACLLAAAALAIAAATPRAAAARGFVAFQFGVPVGPPVYYYPPPPPPVYYYYYYPPLAAIPAPAATQAGQPPQGACHEYQSSAVIDGKTQSVHGTACLQADGTWRIVQ